MAKLIYEIAWPFERPPYAAQRAALAASRGQRGFAFFMDMRLGKTPATLAEYIHERGIGNVEKLIVVTKNYYKQDWIDASEEWGADIHWQKWPWKKIDYDADAYVFNYECLIFSGGDVLMEILQRHDCFLAWDESDELKNFKAKRTKVAISMSQRAQVVRDLTGTPMTQNVMDYWPQLRCIGQLSGVSPYAFRNIFARMGGYMNRQVVGVKNEDRLQDILKGCSVTMLKEDWTDIPPRVYDPPVEYEMTARQQKLYKEMLDEFIFEVGDSVVSAEQVITQMTKLQQIGSGFVYDDDHNTVELVRYEDNPKLKVLIDILHSTPNRKFVVPYFFAASAEIVAQGLAAAGIRFATIRRNVDVVHEKKRFNNDDEVQVCLAQFKSGSRGHTLIGTPNRPCLRTAFWENVYSLLDRRQMEERNRLPDQTEAVSYTDFFGCRQEYKIAKALQKKQNLVTTFNDVLRARR